MPFKCLNSVASIQSLIQLFSLFLLSLMIQACGGSSGSGSIVNQPDGSTPTPAPPTPTTAPPTPVPNPVGDLTISGAVTFDFIPHLTNGGLDYNAITASPVRGATVQLLNDTGTVLAETKTDATGNYALGASANINVRVRVLAALQQVGSSPTWDFRVTDNTQGNALYAMDGALLTSGTVDVMRNLHANSGWDGTRYSGERVSGPFAILDAVYEALQTVLGADPDTDFPAAELRWSTNNVAVPGDLALGLIGTSFYSTNLNSMYILGEEDNDTDENDKRV